LKALEDEVVSACPKKIPKKNDDATKYPEKSMVIILF